MSQDVIDLDASKWNSRLDFYKDILLQIGAPDWHGESVAALVDSLIYGGINSKEPPLRIRVLGSSSLNIEVLDEVNAAKQALEDALIHNKISTGNIIDLEFEIL